MTEKEWLDLGYDKKIIDDIDYSHCDIFENCFIRWFTAHALKVKPQTLDRIEVCYNRYFLQSDFVAIYMIDITENDIVLFINRCILDNNLSRKEYYRIYQIIKGVYDYVVDTRLTLCNAVSFDTVKRYVNKTFSDNLNITRIVSDFEFDCLYNSVVNYKIYSYKQSQCLLLLLNFYLGLRVGELACLRFDDFDLVNRVVYVRCTFSKSFNRVNSSRVGPIQYRIDYNCKTSAGVRIIPLCDSAIELYSNICVWHRLHGYDSDYLCYDGKDIIKPRSLSGCLTRLCKLCDIPHIKTHDIRKTFATRLHNANVPTRIISDLLGHREISTTEHYYIKANKDTEKVREYLNNIFTK